MYFIASSSSFTCIGAHKTNSKPGNGQVDSGKPALLEGRLHLFLDAYGYRDDRAGFGAAVARRARRNAEVMRHMEDTGDPVYGGQLPMIEDLEQAARVPAARYGGGVEIRPSEVYW